MNSWSKNNYETSRKEDRYEPCRKEKRCEEKRCDTFIKCGCSSSNTILEGTGTTVNTTLATLNLDTSCICDPKIKLDFTTNFFFTTATVDGTLSLRLQVFRQCRNQLNPVAIGSTWSIIVPTFARITATLPFSFFICDEDVCSNGDCCIYTIVATPTAVTGATSSFNNSKLIATVTCGENQCHRRCDYCK